MATSDRLTTVYALDENIAVTAGGDFALLCPKWQKLAGGIDGAIAANSWTFTSATAAFAASGVASGHVLWLTKPIATFRGQGDLFAVESASSTTLVMRRIGSAANVGLYPSAADVAAIEYVILTLDPQIEESSFSMNRRFNIDPAVPGRTPEDAYDLRELRLATVLDVLVRRLAAEVQNKADESWALKLMVYRKALDEVLARLSLRWGPTGDAPQSSPWFGTRLVR